jgi:hypothetical protein
MKMPLSLFPQYIIKHYGLLKKALNVYVYMEIRKGVYACRKPAFSSTSS